MAMKLKFMHILAVVAIIVAALSSCGGGGDDILSDAGDDNPDVDPDTFYKYSYSALHKGSLSQSYYVDFIKGLNQGVENEIFATVYDTQYRDLWERAAKKYEAEANFEVSFRMDLRKHNSRTGASELFKRADFYVTPGRCIYTMRLYDTEEPPSDCSMKLEVYAAGDENASTKDSLFDTYISKYDLTGLGTNQSYVISRYIVEDISDYLSSRGTTVTYDLQIYDGNSLWCTRRISAAKGITSCQTLWNN